MVNPLPPSNVVLHPLGPVTRSVADYSPVVFTLVLLPVIPDPVLPALRRVHSPVAARKPRNPGPALLLPGSVELSVEIF